MQQEVDGVPVIAGELIVNLNSADEVISVSGETSPSPSVAAAPGISAGEAADAAIAATAKHSDVDAADLEATDPEFRSSTPASSAARTWVLSRSSTAPR